MTDPHGEYIWQVRSYECGEDGFATLPAICNYLQEAASLHAKSLNFSKSDFEDLNISWVLTRLRVKMTRYPRWEENVKVLTFPRAVRKIVAWRDFVLTSADSGDLLGVASSEWMMIDLEKRKVVAIPQVVYENANLTREPVLGEAPFTPKLKWQEDAALETEPQEFKALNACIDLNGHVNNVHYITWMLEGVPKSAGRCMEAEIVFRSETKAGETVCASSAHIASGERLHRVSSPSGTDHILARTLHIKS